MRRQIKYLGRIYKLSKNYGAGKYYYNRSKGALHRNIWQDTYKKKIPKDFEVHHVDGNCYNNKPSNLGLIKKGVHQRDHWAKRTQKLVTCRQCKKEFLSWFPTRRIQYCSNPCYQKWHYDNKTNHEMRLCKWCGNSFLVRRNEVTQTCSKSHAALLWWFDKKNI